MLQLTIIYTSLKLIERTKKESNLIYVIDVIYFFTN